MKKNNKFYIGLALVIAGAIVLSYYLMRNEKQQDHTLSQAITCKCYCSDLCGPRDNSKPTDAPFIDPETGVCFCQQRDKDNYIPHGCANKNTAFVSCCDQ